MKKFVLLMIPFVFFSCSTKEDRLTEAEKEAVQGSDSRMVEQYTLVKSNVTYTISRIGTVAVKDKVSISSPYEEVVDKVLVREGQKVRSGQTLIRLNTDDLELELEKVDNQIKEAENAVEMAEYQYYEARKNIEKELMGLSLKQTELELQLLNLSNTERLLKNKVELFRANGISKEELLSQQLAYINEKKNYEMAEVALLQSSIGYRKKDLLDAGYTLPESEDKLNDLYVDLNTRLAFKRLKASGIALENVEHQKESIQRALSRSAIKTPLSGIVAGLQIETGERSEKGKSLMVVMSSKEYYLQSSIPENEALYFSEGDVLQLLYKGESIQSPINMVSPVIDSTSKALTVRAVLRDYPKSLKPGTVGIAEIRKKNSEKLLLIPEKFIYEENGDAVKIYTSKNSKLYQKTIETGRRVGDFREVTGGMTEGENIYLPVGKFIQDGESFTVSKVYNNE